MSRRSTGTSVGRLFAIYAVASLLPIVALGAVLSVVLHHVALDRGLSEARAQAALLADSAVAPIFGPRPLETQIDGEETTDMASLVQETLASGEILRLRLRTLDGTVVYASDGSGAGLSADDEVEEAAHGEVAAHITTLNADEGEGGPRVAEVYEPLVVSGVRVGIVELYLPYAPIAQDVSDGMRAMTAALVVGLILLYAVLGAISYSSTRRLRRQAERNAYLAGHDQLTGMLNRFAFHHEVERACAHTGDKGPVGAVAVVDLDRFKQVNDNLGHHNGDALLVELAGRLRRHTRPGDVVARPPKRHALMAGATETAGGAMLALGLATPLAAASLIGTMITAIRTVHFKNGPWVTNGGYEYNLVLIAALTALAEEGPGDVSLDNALGIRTSGPWWALAALGTGAAASAGVVAMGRRTAASPGDAYPEETPSEGRVDVEEPSGDPVTQR